MCLVNEDYWSPFIIHFVLMEKDKIKDVANWYCLFKREPDWENNETKYGDIPKNLNVIHSFKSYIDAYKAKYWSLCERQNLEEEINNTP